MFNLDLKQIGVIVLWIVAVILLLIIAHKVYVWFQKPANAAFIEDAPIPAGWTPNAVTDHLFNEFDGIFETTDNSVLKEFNVLNDNQMIAVYNDWNDRYSQKLVHPYLTIGLGSKWGTLTQALKDRWDLWSTGPNQRDIMVANLERLKLI